MFDLRFAIPQQPGEDVADPNMTSRTDLHDEHRYAEIEFLLTREIAAYETMRGLELPSSQILLWPGLRNALFVFLMTIVKEGGELVVPLPTWAGILELCKELRIRVISIPPGAQGKPNYQAVPQYVTAKTRTVYISEPNNPAGSLLTDLDWALLRQVLTRTPRASLIIDAAYAGYEWVGDNPLLRAHHLSALRQQLVYLNTCSKQAGMPNARIAYIAAPDKIKQHMEKYRTLFGSTCSVLSMVAARRALTSWPSHREALRKTYSRNRELLSGYLAEQFDPDSVPPMAGLYCFPKVTTWQCQRLGRGDLALASRNMVERFRRRGVLVLDGTQFGAPGNIRISHGTGEDYLGGAVRHLQGR